ncbi:hypothetical protein M405DRAFT_780626, partial [Rhizopogon salebrosus TDB-379]
RTYSRYCSFLGAKRTIVPSSFPCCYGCPSRASIICPFRARLLIQQGACRASLSPPVLEVLRGPPVKSSNLLTNKTD